VLWSLSARTGESNALHAHDLVELICCRGGSGRVEFAHEAIELRAGRTIFIAAGTLHRYVFAPGEEAELKLICLNAADLATYLSPMHAAILSGIKSSVADFAGRPEDLARLDATLTLIPDVFGLNDMQELRVAWGAIGLLLALHARAGDAGRTRAPERHREKILQLQSWLDSHLAEPLSLDEAAARCGLSRSLLTREFRRHTGKSLVEYCNTRRVEKAASLLAAGEVRITHVALSCGFANLSHFHHQFKAHYGLPPAAFRRVVAGGNEADEPLAAAEAV
jgi:AraC-like DNA-binding protein